MGLLVNGNWQDKWYDTDSNDGEFKRESAQLRNWITSDGSAGHTGDAGFKAEKGRYHLYVSLACPWAHRTLIFLQLKDLTQYISVSVVSPDMLEHGWEFDQSNHSTGDSLFNHDYLHQLYTRHQADYTGRVTVPLLWDKQQNRIVSNESADIIRMLNTAFNQLTGNNHDFYPADLQPQINEINELVYNNINNGVYRCGFATRQQAYEKAYQQLFAALDKVESILSKNRYLTGELLTEADWRLFTTLIRFDAVYHGHFKCNKQRLADYPNLSGFTRELYQWPGVADTVNFYHIKRHYYFSHTMINPSQVVPAGPDIDYQLPHGRTG
ncbi:putative glutathione S-transferase [Arsukibacterium tuosuense]|uniref:Putative glutathione S-transferase n=1 Tax=Arsukibacterium tuosuense TaxID=1323745 RepID=A0A285ICQ7_9GAMM|nr:glutathione S-transferase family protein [Arsukibacterium tuosuense]SNY45723.1 putative glutathione S-transferase [Arsukibacterium tuosuense]